MDKYGKSQDLDQTCLILCCLLERSPSWEMCHLKSALVSLFPNCLSSVPLYILFSTGFLPEISIPSVRFKDASSRKAYQILLALINHPFLCMESSQGVLSHCVAFITSPWIIIVSTCLLPTPIPTLDSLQQEPQLIQLQGPALSLAHKTGSVWIVELCKLIAVMWLL